MSPPPAAVVRVQLNELVLVARRRRFGGDSDTTADDVFKCVSESDVEQRVDDVVGREADRLHQVGQLYEELQPIIVELSSGLADKHITQLSVS